MTRSCIAIFLSALNDGDAEEAHRIHISLMVDFVAEVCDGLLS